MPRRSNEFQRLIYVIQHELSGEASVTESKMLSNTRTGSPVEVDIVLEAEIGGVFVVVSVECTTSSTRSATVEWVREMIGKHQDLPTNKLVLVSGSGFSEEAELVAKAHGVDTIAFEDAEQFDWQTVLSDLVNSDGLKIASFDAKIDAWRLVFDPAEVERLQALAPLQFDGECSIHRPDGQVQGTVQQFGFSMLRAKPIIEQIIGRWVRDREVHFTVTCTVPADTRVEDSQGNLVKLKQVIIQGHAEVETARLKLTPAKYGATQVAYGKVTDIFSGKPGEATVFLAQREGEEEIGGMAFSSDSGFGKTVFPMQKPSTAYDD